MLPKKSWGLPALALAALIATAGAAFAQDEVEDEVLQPQALRLQVTQAYLGLLVNGQFNQTKISGEGGTSTYENVFIGPDIGLNANGSIYHPNLMNFTIDGDIAVGYLTEKGNEYSAASAGNSGLAEYGNYIVNVNILQEKPYRATLYLDQSYSEQQNDFYNTVQVSSLRYGANLGYQEGPVPFTLELWRQQQQDTGAVYENSTEDQDALVLNASNKRGSGGTSLNYTLGDYTLNNAGGQGSGYDQSASLVDSEEFGGRQEFKLTSVFDYSEGDNTGGSTISDIGDQYQNVNLGESLSIEHSPTLSSSYDASYYYTDSDTPVGTVKGNTINGDISLTHQLYESLTSTLILDGLYDSSDNSFPNDNSGTPNSTSQIGQVTAGVAEAYTKRLGSDSRLTAGASVNYSYVTQQDTGDSVIQSNEPHTFSTATDSFYLNLPEVDQNSIVITNSQSAFPSYLLGIDYTVSENGGLTMIRRTAISNIPQNSKVLVTYTAAAAASGDYETLTATADIRVDFWNGLLGVYARFSAMENFGAPLGDISLSEGQNSNAGVLAGVANMTDYTFGADATWRWLRCGVELDNYDSTYSSETSLNFYQTLAFTPDKASSLSLNFDEAYSQYGGPIGNEQDYSVIVQYRRRVAQNLDLELEGGVEVRNGGGVDQTMAALRPHLRYNIGLTSMDLGYNLEYSKYLNSSTAIEQLLYISIRRSF